MNDQEDRAYRCVNCRRALSERGERQSVEPLSASQWVTISTRMQIVDILCNECRPESLLSAPTGQSSAPGLFDEHMKSVDCFTSDEIKKARQEVGREIGMRRGAYPRFINSGRLTVGEAEEQMDRIEKAYAILKWAETTGQKVPRPQEKAGQAT